jgi:hypothetical protein
MCSYKTLYLYVNISMAHKHIRVPNQDYVHARVHTYGCIHACNSDHAIYFTIIYITRSVSATSSEIKEIITASTPVPVTNHVQAQRARHAQHAWHEAFWKTNRDSGHCHQLCLTRDSAGCTYDRAYVVHAHTEAVTNMMIRHTTCHSVLVTSSEREYSREVSPVLMTESEDINEIFVAIHMPRRIARIDDDHSPRFYTGISAFLDDLIEFVHI